MLQSAQQGKIPELEGDPEPWTRLFEPPHRPLGANFELVPLINYGSIIGEAGAYLSFIIERYDDLPCVLTVRCKGEKPY